MYERRHPGPGAFAAVAAIVATASAGSATVASRRYSGPYGARNAKLPYLPT